MQLDDVRRENKSLSDEIKDLMEQISEGGRSIHEIEKQRKKLEQEKFELETALGDAESALEQEENKLLRLSLEVNQVRADIGKSPKNIGLVHLIHSRPENLKKSRHKTREIN